MAGKGGIKKPERGGLSSGEQKRKSPVTRTGLFERQNRNMGFIVLICSLVVKHIQIAIYAASPTFSPY